MQAPARNERQQFTGHAYTRVELYEIVREVALLAGRPGTDPRRVTQKSWNAARSGSRWPDAPEAKEMCVQLADARGRPWSWRSLLQSVFTGKSLERLHMARMSADDDHEIDREVAFHALRRVAAYRGQMTLVPHDYAAGREAMLAEHGRRWKHVSTLEQLLPTVDQLRTAAKGGWSAVLAWADLPEPAAPLERRGHSRPYPEAILSFWEETGVVPHHRWLVEYARDKEFALAPRPKGSQSLLVDQARALARERGREMPAFDPKAERPTWLKAPDRRDGEAAPLERVTNVRAISALIEFAAHCARQSPKKHPAKSYYGTLQRDASGPYRQWPAASRMQDRDGSWDEQIRGALLPGALDRARAEDLATLQGEELRRAQTRQGPYEGRGSADSPRALRMLELLRERSPQTNRELREVVGGRARDVNADLRALIDAGLVERVAGGRSSAYAIAGTTRAS